MDTLCVGILAGIQDSSQKCREIARLAYLNMCQRNLKKAHTMIHKKVAPSLQKTLTKAEAEYLNLDSSSNTCVGIISSKPIPSETAATKAVHSKVQEASFSHESDLLNESVDEGQRIDNLVVETELLTVEGDDIADLESTVLQDESGDSPVMERVVVGPPSLNLRSKRLSYEEEAAESIQAVMRGNLSRKKSPNPTSMRKSFYSAEANTNKSNATPYTAVQTVVDVPVADGDTSVVDSEYMAALDTGASYYNLLNDNKMFSPQQVLKEEAVTGTDDTAKLKSTPSVLTLSGQNTTTPSSEQSSKLASGAAIRVSSSAQRTPEMSSSSSNSSSSPTRLRAPKAFISDSGSHLDNSSSDHRKSTNSAVVTPRTVSRSPDKNSRCESLPKWQNSAKVVSQAKKLTHTTTPVSCSGTPPASTSTPSTVGSGRKISSPSKRGSLSRGIATRTHSTSASTPSTVGSSRKISSPSQRGTLFDSSVRPPRNLSVGTRVWVNLKGIETEYGFGSLAGNKSLAQSIAKLELEQNGSSCEEEPNSSLRISGIIRFVGLTSCALGYWLGLELDAAVGNSNGTAKGISYFKCKDLFGAFARANAVTLPAKDEVALDATETTSSSKRIYCKNHVPNTGSTSASVTEAQYRPESPATTTSVLSDADMLRDLLKMKISKMMFLLNKQITIADELSTSSDLIGIEKNMREITRLEKKCLDEFENKSHSLFHNIK